MSKRALENLDSLSNGALELALELRRLGIGILSDQEEGELFLWPASRLTPEMLARVKEHGPELMALIERQGAT